MVRHISRRPHRIGRALEHSLVARIAESFVVDVVHAAVMVNNGPCYVLAFDARRLRRARPWREGEDSLRNLTGATITTTTRVEVFRYSKIEARADVLSGSRDGEAKQANNAGKGSDTESHNDGHTDAM